MGEGEAWKAHEENQALFRVGGSKSETTNCPQYPYSLFHLNNKPCRV